LLRDRAQLLGALHDHRRGKRPDLPESELEDLVRNIERRIAHLDERLQAFDA
jgi:hypothetical protein